MKVLHDYRKWKASLSCHSIKITQLWGGAEPVANSPLERKISRFLGLKSYQQQDETFCLI